METWPQQLQPFARKLEQALRTAAPGHKVPEDKLDAVVEAILDKVWADHDEAALADLLERNSAWFQQGASNLLKCHLATPGGARG